MAPSESRDQRLSRRQILGVSGVGALAFAQGASTIAPGAAGGSAVPAPLPSGAAATGVAPQPPPATGADAYVLDPRAFGAAGNGVTDDSAALRACVDAALASRGGGTAPARVRIQIPPGRYLVTEPDVLMSPSDGDDDGITGLTVAGFGKGVTEIEFAPRTTSRDPAVGNLWSANKRTRWVTVESMTISSRNPGASAFYFIHDGQGNNQNEGCVFRDLHFTGDWRRVFGFDGGADANLNSEMTFVGISSGSAVFSDAFFKVGGISGTYNQQNQFLNYWIYDSVFNLRGGTLFDFVKGGSAHFVNGSWSASSGDADPMTFLRLGPNLNNTSAANFTVRGVRFEPKSGSHVVLDEQLGQGSVLFEGCSDVASLQTSESIDLPLRRHTGASPWGQGIHANVTYRGCSLAGHDLYDGPSARRGWIAYDGCHFWRGTNGEFAVPTQDDGNGAVLRWTDGAPRYRFLGSWNAPDAASPR